MRVVACSWAVGLLLVVGCDGADRSGPPLRNRLAVRCDQDGIAVEETSVVASSDGVHVRVDNTTAAEVPLVADPVQENPTSHIGPGVSTVVITAVPGPVELRCDPSPSVTVTVEDPHGFHHSVDVDAALGCQVDATLDSHEFGWGHTPREAAEDFAAGRARDVRITRGNGYRDLDRQQFLLHVDGQGLATLDAYRDIDPNGNERYRASWASICSERIFPNQPSDGPTS